MVSTSDEFYGTGGPGTIVGTLDTLGATSTPTPATPRAASIALLDRLGRELTARATTIERFDAYYRGRQGRRFIGTKYRELFAKIFEGYAENFCGVVVDAVEERLDIEGFRFPRPTPGAIASNPDAADGGEPDSIASTDADAWRIWQDNGLDARSQIAHTEALVKSVVYVLVSPFPRERVFGRSPRITIEDPCSTIVELAPGTTERIVGMKRWTDAAGTLLATLYFPDRIEKWRARERRWANQYSSGVTGQVTWEERYVDGEPWPLPHTLGVVPLVPLVNRPRLDGSGQSEIEQIIPIQDAINTIAINELVASETAAFPQKWATGIEIPIDPETGKPTEPWKPDIDAIMATKVADAKFGQFVAAELAQYGGAIDARIKRIASITRTPYHYFLDHGGQPPSGTSLRSSETGLVRKARRRSRQFGEGWEEVMRLAFKTLGDDRAGISDAATVWANPESLTESEHMDALSKARTSLLVPLEVLWEDAGYSPQQRRDFRRLLEAERTWLNSTPVATTQPDATPAPDAMPAATGPAAPPVTGGSPDG